MIAAIGHQNTISSIAIGVNFRILRNNESIVYTIHPDTSTTIAYSQNIGRLGYIIIVTINMKSNT